MLPTSQQKRNGDFSSNYEHDGQKVCGTIRVLGNFSGQRKQPIGLPSACLLHCDAKGEATALVCLAIYVAW